eukprot:3109248-Pyramimonas_sp.AAC.1
MLALLCLFQLVQTKNEPRPRFTGSRSGRRSCEATVMFNRDACSSSLAPSTNMRSGMHLGAP